MTIQPTNLQRGRLYGLPVLPILITALLWAIKLLGA